MSVLSRTLFLLCLFGTVFALVLLVTPAEDAVDSHSRAEPDVPGRSAVVANSACLDGSFRIKPYGNRRAHQLQYWVGDGPVPAGLTRAAFAAVVIDSVDNITRETNSCGLPDRMPITQRFRGATGREANVANLGTRTGCGTPDGVSVIDAGHLDGRALATTCTYTVRRNGVNIIVESDIRLDTDQRFTTHPGSDCRNAFDLEAVLTHEFGHAFGLSHVSELAAPTLTMSEHVPPCDASQRTLGRGDVRGLDALYR